MKDKTLSSSSLVFLKTTMGLMPLDNAESVFIKVQIPPYAKDGQQTPHERSDYTTQVNLRKQTYLRRNNIEVAVGLKMVTGC
jgi:hypothetical protein